MGFVTLTHSGSSDKIHVLASRITAIRERSETGLTLAILEGGKGHYVNESADMIMSMINLSRKEDVRNG